MSEPTKAICVGGPLDGREIVTGTDRLSATDGWWWRAYRRVGDQFVRDSQADRLRSPLARFRGWRMLRALERAQTAKPEHRLVTRRHRSRIAWLVAALIAAGGGYLLVSQQPNGSPTPTYSPSLVAGSGALATGTIPATAPPATSAAPASASALATSTSSPTATATSSSSGAVGLPNPALTPGATNPSVTQATIGQTICVSGWTATIRPPSSYTTNLKIQQLADPRYGDTADQVTSHYEEDHLIPLELGGAPSDPANLWPEPWTLTLNGVDVGAHAKDSVENRLKREVCAGTLTLVQAQLAIATNWEAAP